MSSNNRRDRFANAGHNEALRQDIINKDNQTAQAHLVALEYDRQEGINRLKELSKHPKLSCFCFLDKAITRMLDRFEQGIFPTKNQLARIKRWEVALDLCLKNGTLPSKSVVGDNTVEKRFKQASESYKKKERPAWMNDKTRLPKFPPCKSVYYRTNVEPTT